MPRDSGTGTYTVPDGTRATTQTAISSTAYNGLLDDLEALANEAHPISKGGTGASDVSSALTNLGLDNVLNNSIHSAWRLRP